jgi:mono/diheme cytochrome c family protein
VTGPNLDRLGRIDEERVLNAIRNGGTGKLQMPAGILEGENAKAVASYVSRVAGQ